MEARKPTTIGLTVLAYVAATFGVQGASHFAVFAAHYAAIPIMRAEPVIATGLGSMLIQGVLFALLFPAFQRGSVAVWDGVKFSWALGGFLASYIRSEERRVGKECRARWEQRHLNKEVE